MEIIVNKIDEGNLYKKMYLHLFNAVTDAIKAKSIDEKNNLLIVAQCETEEIFIHADV